MKFYQKSKEELLHSYDVKIDRGLSSTQVSDNRERYGENKLPEEKEESYLRTNNHCSIRGSRSIIF